MSGPTAAATPRQVFERVLSAIEHLEMEAYADLFAADGTFEVPFAPPRVPRRIEGREAIRAFFRAATGRAGAAAPRFTFSSVVVHETVDPEVILAEYQVHGVAAGRPYQFTNVGVLTVRNGEIVSLRDYWNPLDRPELAALTGPG